MTLDIAKLHELLEAATPSGIEIHRTICPGGILSFMETERWRLHTGGGIAGNSE